MIILTTFDDDAYVFDGLRAGALGYLLKDGSGQELAEAIRGAVGFDGEIAWDASKPDGTPRKLLDVSRLTRLGWRPAIGLDAGIRSTYEWYRSATARAR